VTVTSAVLLVLSVALVALVVGFVVGGGVMPRLAERNRRIAVQQAGLTVSQMLQRIVALSPTGVAVVDNHRDVVFMNPRAQELGLVRDRLLDERAWTAARRVLAGGEDVDIDLSPTRSASGRSALAVRGRVRLLSEEDPRFAVIYVFDDSEVARMEATRRDFVANVSHELKTPVGAMGLLAEALLESADDPETVRRFGDKMHLESQRLANMVTELIELSRLQGAERLPELEAVDVDTVIGEALSRSKLAADIAHISIATDRASGFKVLGDQALLVTALANLVSNAIAYSPPGSPVSISRRRRGTNIEISVTDRGIGIAR
jgi:two-component system sensor histidine kinase SenX3